MSENTIIVLLLAGVGLWMAGGKFWKGWRRFVWPVVAAICVISSGVSLVRGALLALGLVGVNSLPYGDRTPWVVRVLVFLALPLPALILGTGAWIIVPLTGATLAGLFWLSRRFNFITWKVWESSAGLLQAASIIAGVLA